MITVAELKALKGLDSSVDAERMAPVIQELCSKIYDAVAAKDSWKHDELVAELTQGIDLPDAPVYINAALAILLADGTLESDTVLENDKWVDYIRLPQVSEDCIPEGLRDATEMEADDDENK